MAGAAWRICSVPLRMVITLRCQCWTVTHQHLPWWPLEAGRRVDDAGQPGLQPGMVPALLLVVRQPTDVPVCPTTGRVARHDESAASPSGTAGQPCPVLFRPDPTRLMLSSYNMVSNSLLPILNSTASAELSELSPTVQDRVRNQVGRPVSTSPPSALNLTSLF